MVEELMDNKTSSLRVVRYKAMVLLMRLLSVGMLAVVALFLLPLAVPYVKNAFSFKYIRVAMGIEKAISSFVHGIIPTVVTGHDLTRWIVVISALLLWGLFSSLKERYRNTIYNVKVRREYEDWKSQMHLSEDAKILSPLKEKLKNLQGASNTDREELLKLFAETKRKLDSMGRDLAFLSIDVVDSTGLKEGEEKAAIEYDFKEYKNFVESKLKANGALKSTWTPDGVMSCFPAVDAAVAAAQEVVGGLDAFNKHVKTIRKDFRVRCGINAGYVYFDDSIPMEEMSDRVIDIAGHMQKHAPPNTVCIAKPAIEPMKERSGFVPVSKVVDGYEMYVWERRKIPRQ